MFRKNNVLVSTIIIIALLVNVSIALFSQESGGVNKDEICDLIGCPNNPGGQICGEVSAQMAINAGILGATADAKWYCYYPPPM